jgi:hypothetical protein
MGFTAITAAMNAPPLAAITAVSAIKVGPGFMKWATTKLSAGSDNLVSKNKKGGAVPVLLLSKK